MRLLSRDQCGERLESIFPPDLIEDSRTAAGPLAGAAVYTCLACQAIDGRNPIRPSMVLWMCDGVARRITDAPDSSADSDRLLWYQAALQGHRRLAQLVQSWGIEHRPWYADNSRESLRDETFHVWKRVGAIAHDPSLPTTSPRPGWTLQSAFASLFAPTLGGEELDEAIREWQDEHLGTVGRARIRLASEREAAAHAVEVRLPNGSVRALAPGDSSLILKAVIERLAPRLMKAPGVVAISQSKRKIDVADEELLRDLGLTIEASKLLPDALLFDGAAGRFWFVEAVATDGEIHESRRRELLGWAQRYGIPATRCGFVSGFLSRAHDAYRRRGARLAWGTCAWFLDEPERILHLDTLPIELSND